MYNLRLILSFILATLSCLLLSSGAMAQSYGTKDAQYVTNSRNSAVLRYIVCLELVAGTLPSSMSLPNRIKRGEDECRSAAARLPNSSREPDASDIRAMIMECGFRPGEESPGFDCGDAPAASGNGQFNQIPNRPVVTRPAPNIPRINNPLGAPFVGDEVVLAPRIIELGKWVGSFALDGNDLWVPESGQRTLAKVNYRTGRIDNRFKVGRLPINSLVIGRNAYTLVATDKVLLKHNRNGRKTALARLTDCPETMTASGRNIFVLGMPNCSSESSRVIRIDSRTGKMKTSQNLGEWAQSIATVGSEIWVGHARHETISIVDKSRLTFEKMDLGGIEAWAMAANSRSVFAGGRYESTDSDGSIVMIDARSRQEISRYSVTELVAKMTANEDYVVAVGQKGTIWVFSAHDLTFIRQIRSTTGDIDPRNVVIDGNDLLVSSSQHRGQDGAILVFSDFLPNGVGNITTGQQSPTVRPTRPTTNVRPTRPTTQTRPTRQIRPTIQTKPTRPSRPTVASQSGLPVLASSYGGRVRSEPNLNGTQVASTLEGDDVTLFRRTNSIYRGYPWFSIELANGQSGYQWGGIICSYDTFVSGTKELCVQTQPSPANNLRNTRPSRPSRPNRPSNPANNSNTNPTGADVLVGVLDLFGKIIENENKPKNNGGYQASNNAGASNSQLVVGTYSSNSATSGNIQFNQHSNSLTWTEFCGPTITLTPNWNRSVLRPSGGNLQPFRLKVQNGAVVGFKSGRDTYSKQNGVMMPGCVQPTQKPTNNTNPQPSDPRASNDYSLVLPALKNKCDRFMRNKKRITRYYDCMDQALMDSLEELEDGASSPVNTPQAAQDPRINNPAYGNLPMGYLSSCAQTHGENSSPYFDCLDEAIVSESINRRVENKFSDLTEQEILGCSSYGYGSKDFFNCLLAVRANKAQQNSTPSAVAPQTNADKQVLIEQLGTICVANYGPADVEQCKVVMSQCINNYFAAGDAAMEQCIKGSGW
ncbi:SH3 domain-containing protein [Cohaesibacter celericrescens]|nr:SH3 domain-containing protein [Cohaesibacter celericrescens]